MSIEIIESNFDIIRANPDFVDWVELCQCSWALSILEENLDKIYWEVVSCYEWAYEFVLRHLNDNEEAKRCSLESLSRVEWALPILLEHPEYIWWDCAIHNPCAKQIFSTHFDKINWKQIYECPDWLLDIISDNVEIMDWSAINLECVIIRYPYERLKKRLQDVRKELIEYLFYPDRIRVWIEAGNDIEDYME